MTRPLYRRATAAIALASFLALTPVLTATAIGQNVENPGWRWISIVDDGYAISDADSYYDDFLGTGVSMFGWRDDAFDTMMRVSRYESGAGGFVDAYPIVRFGADELSVLPVSSVSSSWVAGGRTTTVGTAEADFGDGRVVTLTFTLEVEGSIASWTVDREVVGGDPADVELIIGGDLGSDGDSTYVDLGGGAWISHDGNRGDPVIGWLMSGAVPTMGVPGALGNVEFLMSGAGTSTITVALLDYDECAFDEALAQMTAAAPTLALGVEIPPIYTTDCLTTDAPASIALGDELAASLPLVPAPALDAENWIPSSAELFTERGFRVDVVDAPDGLEATLEWVDLGDGAFTLVLSGTPTEAWSGPATFVIHYGRLPVLVEVDLQVVGPPELAATGVDESITALVVAALLSVGGGVVLSVMRRSAASAVR